MYIKQFKLQRFNINYLQFILLYTMFGTWVYHSDITWIKTLKYIHAVHFNLNRYNCTGRNARQNKKEASLVYETVVFKSNWLNICFHLIFVERRKIRSILVINKCIFNVFVCTCITSNRTVYNGSRQTSVHFFFCTTLEMRKILLLPIYERYYIDPIQNNDFLLQIANSNE